MLSLGRHVKIILKYRSEITSFNTTADDDKCYIITELQYLNIFALIPCKPTALEIKIHISFT